PLPHFYVHASFVFNSTATTEIYLLSLHDALPIWSRMMARALRFLKHATGSRQNLRPTSSAPSHLPRTGETIWKASAFRSFHLCRSEEHTSELQSRDHVVCRLLREKKKISPPAHGR